MALPKFSSNQIISAAVLPLLVLAIGAAGLWILWPKFQSVGEVRAELAEKERNAALYLQELENLKTLISVYQSNRERLGLVERSLPSAPKVPDLLSNVEILAQQSGLSIGVISIVPAAAQVQSRGGRGSQELARTEEILGKSENLGILDVNIEVSGFYPNVRAFLENIEQNMRIISIEQIGIATGEESGEQDYSLNMKTYYQKE